MAARVFRGTNNRSRSFVDVVRLIDNWLDELGDDFVVLEIREETLTDVEGEQDVVIVNAVKFDEKARRES